MKFILNSGGRCGPRLGKLVWATPSGAEAPPLDTPLCLLYTRGGAVPNLTRDLEEEVVGLCYGDHVTRGQGQGDAAGHVTGSMATAAAALLTMPTMYMNSYQLLSADVVSQFKGRIHGFLKRESQLLYLSMQDPATRASHKFNMENSVAVWTKYGRSKVGVDDHVRLLRAFRPNAFECLYDIASSKESKMKRINKSVNRTLRFLDDTIAATREHQQELSGCSVLGAVVGGDVMSERLRSARETAARPVDGFVLEGLDVENSECLQEFLTSVNQCLPEDKPRFIHSLHTPEDILLAVSRGVDVFETSYAYKAAENGRAVVFPRGQRSRPIEGRGVDKESECKESPRQFEIDLKEERYAVDFDPFLPGCGCYACSHHTRAYTHHLLVTNEILAKILLMIHNLSHYLAFFADLRDSIRHSSFQKFQQSCLN